MPFIDDFPRNVSRTASQSPTTRATTPDSSFGDDGTADSRVHLKHSVLPTNSTLPEAPCFVTDLFAHQVSTKPHAPAIQSYKDPFLSYSELDHLSACIATTLAVQPRTIVPICMDVSIPMIATILAVLKIGATYVLLDPQGSVERNKTIAQDADSTCVITERAYALQFDNTVVIENILSKVSAGLITPKHFSPTRAGNTTKDPAYLIYTSGTTGRPKGVVLSHRAVTYGITNTKLNGRSRWLLFYNPIFSAAQRTILATLCHGATLCLAPRAVMATDLREIISSMQIDALGITPSALATLDADQAPSCLRQITTVGEKLSASIANSWKDVVNLRVSYGCSECAQLSLSRQIEFASDAAIVGSPSDTTTAFILKPGSFDRCAPNEIGELCLMGPQLASGYWKLPEVSAKVFVDSPFGRLYRSGDLAVENDDGAIEIRGRIDHQMKIAGQRLEPEEVASVLAGHSKTADIHVFAASIKDEMSVVAAVVPRQVDAHSEDWSELVASLRHEARAKLPTYMVPTYWLRCEKLPWNSNFKVDTKQLRAIAESTHPKLMLALKAPRDGSKLDMELDSARQRLRDIWAEQLSIDAKEISGAESFVELGGSSIAAIRVVRLLRQDGFAVELGSLVQPIALSSIPYKVVTDDTAEPLERLELVQDTAARAQLASQRAIVDAYPVSALQESLLASSLSGQSMYLYQRSYDVRHLDLRRLKLAFSILFYSHETLRSTFIMDGGRLLQVVRNDFKLSWSESNERLADFKRRDKEAGMALGDSFVRFTVLNKEILVVTMHHALFDFWSHGFLYDDAAKLYHGFDVESRPTWGSYVKYLQELDWSAAETFWREYMAGTQPTLINHAPTPSTHEARRIVPFDGKAVSAALGATSGTIIYAAWALVLAQHTCSTDVVFATAMSGRDASLRDVDKLDGPTLTIVPQRIQFVSDETLLQIVQKTGAGLSQLNKHSQYGMRKALTAAGVSGKEKLFDSFVNILVTDATASDDSLMQDVFYPYGALPMWETGYTTLQVEESNGQLNLKLLADMEESRVNYMLEQFTLAIQTLITAPKAPFTSLDLVGKLEREALTAMAQPSSSRPRLLHAQFESLALYQPARPALQWQSERVFSYSELNQQASRMAAFLYENGFSSGDLVPLLMEKSPFMVIAILAVLKLGAAYVPLSPDNPVERNAYIFGQIDAKAVLVDKETEAFFGERLIQTLAVDNADLTTYSPYFSSGRISSKSLAYIIFTSGSTGMPKGVRVSHAAASAFADSMNDFLGRTEDATRYRTLQFSNYVFDVSVYDIFTTLSSGSTLCMAPSERLLSELSTVITEMGVTHCFLTPTVVKLLKPDEVPTLKTMAVGGEPMSNQIIETWTPHLRLINGYGPTEASVIVSSCDINTNTLTRNIGQPLGNMSAVVLDPSSDKLQPYGAAGEICFIGPQLADGYHKDADKTGKAFYVPTSVPDIPRMYRSGDLGRWLPGGELECLGRKDYQVKVNGFRIELGEIEANLLSTGAVVDTAVVVSEVNTKVQLVAFVVFEAGEQDHFLPLEGLEEAVAKMKAGLNTLTPYMIPRFVLPLAKMPKMPSGKIDRKMLKQWGDALTSEQQRTYSYASIGGSSEECIPLNGKRQRLLAEAWVEVLGLEPTFGQEADFFELGGDSIAAITLTSVLRTKGFNIKVGEIMAASKLPAMSEVMQVDESAGAELAQFEPASSVVDAFSMCEYMTIYPCPPGQAEFLQCGSKPESFWTLMATRKLAPGTVVADWLKLVRNLTEENEILRTTYAQVEGSWYGAVLPDSTPEVKIHEITDPSRRQEVIDAVWTTRFTTGKPFISYNILRSPDGTLEVCTKLDHGLYDGTLLRIFGDQAAAIAAGTALPKSTPFSDFAMHEWSSNKEEALSFWTHDTRRPTTFKYPATAEPQQQPAISASVVHMCPTPLESLAKQHALSASVIYQAAFNLWLARRSNSLDVECDYLYTGRNVSLPDPQSINGTCANFLPLRIDIRAGSAETVKAFVTRVQADFWSATENGNVNLEDIYAAANTNRAESGNNSLFLFQPFEPPAQKKAADIQKADERWIVMAISEVKMPQPYALVCEVIRTKGEEHKLKLGYDPAVFTAEQVKSAAEEIEGIVDGIAGGFERSVEELLDL